MEHRFNIEIARDVEERAAVILDNIFFWCEHNRANNKNYHDGRFWTYNSAKAFLELFPYMTERKISTALDTLEKKGYIIKGCYNQNKYDRTKWYAVTEKTIAFYKNAISISPTGEMDITKTSNAINDNVKSIRPVGEIDSTETSNGYHENVQPIPDNNTDNNTSAVAINQEIQKNNLGNKIIAADFLDINKIKEELKQLDNSFVFDNKFYPRAITFINTHSLDLKYLAWLYEYCKSKKPQNLRNLFYTLFFKDDLQNVYKDSRQKEIEEVKKQKQLLLTQEVICPICNTKFNKNNDECNSCGFPTKYLEDECEIKRNKKIYAMDTQTKRNYENEIFRAITESMKKRIPVQEIRNEIDKKYGLLEI